MPRHHPSPPAHHGADEPSSFGALPPRVVARPVQRPGGVIVSWNMGGTEAAPTAAAGTIGQELLGRPTTFALEVRVGQFATRRPVNRVRMELRSPVTGATHAVEIARGPQGRLIWAVDGRPLTGVETAPGALYPALPTALFGEYLAVDGIDPASGVAPSVIIEW